MTLFSHLVYPGCGRLPGQHRQGGEDDVPVLCLGLGGMEDGPVAVHERHGGGEVEDAGGQDEGVVAEVVGLADHEAVDVEVEAVRVEHHGGEEAAGQGAGEEQNEQAHLAVKQEQNSKWWYN